MIDRGPVRMSAEDLTIQEMLRIGQLPTTAVRPNLNDGMTLEQRRAFDQSVMSGNSVSDPKTVHRATGATMLVGAEVIAA